MTMYMQLIDELNAKKEESFARFQRKLIPTKQTILGVRTPTLRAIAKKYAGEVEKVFAFPDEFYEVTFIKLTIVSMLPYEKFVLYIEECVDLIDNWATCDSFKPKCIRENRDSFLPILERIFEKGGEFQQRYPLVALLYEYIDERYLPVIRTHIQKADTKLYYVKTAVAWLVAELLAQRYEDGIALLNENFLDEKTRNKAIQKAIESYRIDTGRKEYLRSLKINRTR